MGDAVTPMTVDDFSDGEVPPPPAPFAGTPPRRRRAKDKAKPAPRLQAIRDALSNAGQTTSCLVCDCQTYPKSKFCKEHKREAEACRKDAEDQGELEYYNQQASNKESFRKMILEYMDKSPSRGPGAKRNRFDWTTYREKTYSGKAVRKGQKEVPLHYETWSAYSIFLVVLQIIFAVLRLKTRFLFSFKIAETIEKFMKFQQEDRGLSWQDADKLWEDYKADPDHERDELGPPQSQLRLYTAVEDYLIRETVSGFQRERVSGVKDVKNPTEKQAKELDDRLAEPLPGFEELQLEHHSGKTKSQFLQSGPVVAVPMHGRPSAGRIQPGTGKAGKKDKEMGRRRAKAYDEVLKKVREAEVRLPRTLKQAEQNFEHFQVNNSVDDYEHFIRLVDVRIRVLKWLVETTDEAQFQQRLEGLGDSERSLLPVDTKFLHLPKHITNHCQQILGMDTDDKIDELKEYGIASSQLLASWLDLAQLATGTERGVSDLQAAKVSREKNEARMAKADAKKAQLQKRKEENQAKTAEQKAEEAARAKRAKMPNRLDKLPTTSLKDVMGVGQGAFEHLDGTKPFVIRAALKLSPKLLALTKEKGFEAAHKAFMQTYHTTTAAKGTGRAQCGLKPVELMDQAREALREFVPFRSNVVTTEHIPNLDMVSMFGFLAGMYFVSSEYEGTGQLRYILGGTKDTYACSLKDIQAAMLNLGLEKDGKKSSDADVYKFYRHLTEEQVSKSGLTVYKVAVRQGDAYYLPSGWVMGDICGDEACIGLRLTTISDRDIVQEKNVEAMIEIQDQANSKHLGNMKKIVEVLNKHSNGA
ncbi:unnamed protein product [Symbiodinium sp. CCMP2592]|nr:unnamed protein product [Symbiodinium sp. CCMP2592]